MPSAPSLTWRSRWRASTGELADQAPLARPDLREVPVFSFSVREVQPASPEDRFYFVPGEPLLPGTDYLAQVAIQAHAPATTGVG